MNFFMRVTGRVPGFDRLAVRTAALLVFVVAVIALSSCGSSDDGTSPKTSAAAATTETSTGPTDAKAHPGSVKFGGPQPLEFEADPNGKLAFTSDEVTAKEGNAVIEFTNPQSTPHNVAIKSASGGMVESKTISKGFTAGPSLTLRADQEYIFFCTIPGHREAGMEGVLKVVPQ